MDTKDIMNNEEVFETTVEIVTERSGSGIKLAAGIGLAVLMGVIVYQYVAKPILAKIKAEQEPQEITGGEIEIVVAEEQDSE